jgi:two-component system response regulator YesN
MRINQNDLKIVTQLTLILKHEYKHHHSHSSLAAHFYINERKMRNIFKQVTGTTINDFLTEVRIEKTKELLSNTDDPIKRIASNVGYDISTLEKHFKKFTGKTPLEWRQQEMELLIYDKMNAVKRK